MNNIMYLYLAIVNFVLLLFAYLSYTKNHQQIKYLYALTISEILWVVLYVFPLKNLTSDYVNCIVKLI
ncbi:MAG: hypothetical protein AMQ74_00563 [Candidatus Methanofastidiosum methylothiophilum]|uniref:Uncharacterized protein n=1 Tax=Candidatus Methanofastidiosum methylothiophilum TaxID=1705564 RepID=A0A150J7J0_9EURY|nr:MAG: hypothetical protein AMQ74_00563 [Candidatus Methanofastidiosum methylthiophilus]